MKSPEFGFISKKELVLYLSLAVASIGISVYGVRIYTDKLREEKESCIASGQIGIDGRKLAHFVPGGQCEIFLPGRLVIYPSGRTHW